MTSITPSLVPSIAPGNLFRVLTQDTTLAIRWLRSGDPAFYEVLNRPIVDVALRELMIAKTVDSLSQSIGHQAIFPFLTQAQVTGTSGDVDIPHGWIWDIHMSTPAKWENFRLAKIKRISGVNGTDGSSGGILRLIFTAVQISSSIETAIFYADYEIDSELTYQRSRLTVVTTDEETTVISAGEHESVNGFITFRTLDQSDPIVETFYDALDPGSATDSDGDGVYDSPTEFEIVDTLAGSTELTNDYSQVAVSHGTGLLVDSSNNAIPATDSDIQTWLSTFNYPFDSEANLTSYGSVNLVIPTGLFREFNITAPAGDEPSGDTSGTYYPVWISRIALIGTDNNTIRLYFSTYNITDSNPGVDGVEFATLDLINTMVAGDRVAINPISNLLLESGTGSDAWQQHFGRGHVTLSSIWDNTDYVTDFFAELADVSTGEIDFTTSSTLISSFGISRCPKYVPTIGQSQALAGTTSNLDSPVDPGTDNKYVTEKDQGLGNTVDLESSDYNLSPVSGIDRYGYSGALAHRIVKLCIDGSKLPSGSDTGASSFYAEEILPRLTVLLGRPAQFGDFWFDGTRLKFFNGDTWQG